MAAKLEEFGSISMSAPLLSRPDPAFAFDLNKPVSEYFDDAKKNVQGGAASLQQVVQSFAFSGAVQADPTQMAAYGEKLRLYYQQLSRSQEQQQLLDSATRDEYRADLLAAEQESDPQVRAQKIAEARQNLANHLAPQATPPSFPLASDVGTPPAAPTPGATPSIGKSALLNSGAFAAAGKLLPSGLSPVVSDRTALVTAAGDKAVESIFRALGNPGEAQRFKGKIVLFAVATVSVDPGWRTKKDFAADLAVHLGYKYMKARREVLDALVRDQDLPAPFRDRLVHDHQLGDYRVRLPGDPTVAVTSARYDFNVPAGWGCEKVENCSCEFASVRNPVTTAVSPMTETQTLDLASASRRIDEVAIALSFALRSAGLGGQANAFEDFVKSRQLDVQTRTANVAANSYSAGGGVFGYEVGPQLKAIENPSSDSSGAANVLDRQSFPVLIVLGLDQSDVRPRLRWVDDHANSLDAHRLEVYEPELTFTQTSRWVPLKRPWYSFGGAFIPRWSEEDRLKLSYDLNLAFDRASRWQTTMSDSSNVVAGGDDEGLKERTRAGGPALGLAKERSYVWKHFAFGSQLDLTLPVDYLVPGGMLQMPKLDAVAPDHVTLVKTTAGVEAAKVSVAIVGTHLDQVVLSKIAVATGNAVIAKGTGARRVESAIVVPLQVRDASSPIILELPFDPVAAHASNQGFRGSLYTRPILVSAVEKAKAKGSSSSSTNKTAKSQNVQTTKKTTKKTSNNPPTQPQKTPAAVTTPSPTKKS